MPILDPRDDIADLLVFLRREPVLNTIALGLLKEAADPAQRSKCFLASGERGTPGMPQQVHQLRAVRPHPFVPGHPRPLGADDLQLATAWMAAFFAESGAGEGARPGWAREAAAIHVGRGSLHFWLNPDPVCMAGGRETSAGVARIGPVYTPPALHRQGYAGALVADLSQRLLDGGCHTCCLFTDVRNLTSNHVYAEVGYQPVASVNEVWFRPA